MNALVIGAGRMGTFHARVLADLGYTVTTVDPLAPADHQTVPGWHYDLAAIATPISHLLPYAWSLLNAGTPTLVEKPVSASPWGVQRLLGTQRNTGTPCTVGLVERFNPCVLALKAHLAQHPTTTATFTRINDRPSPNVTLDLRMHDVDLAAFLGLDPAACTYRTAADAQAKVRRIDTPELSVDLTAHTESPLHGLWQAFIAGAGYPTLEDALAAHEALRRQTLAVAA